jgi:hypothetical protein
VDEPRGDASNDMIRERAVAMAADDNEFGVLLVADMEQR